MSRKSRNSSARARNDRVILIDGAYGNGNLGDELILSRLVRVLAPVGARIIAVSANPADTARRHGVEALPRPMRVSSGLLAGIASLPWRAARIARALSRADTYILGGGSLLSDEWGTFTLIRYVLLAAVARLCGAKVILAGIGIGTLSTRIGRLCAGRLLNISTMVWARDTRTAAFVESAAPLVPLISSWDIVFGMDTRAVEQQGRPMLGVSVRDFPASLHYAAHEALRDRFIASIAGALDEIVESTEAGILFIPFRVDGSAGNDRLDDASLASAITASMNAWGVVDVAEIASEDDLAAAFGRCRVVLAERYHAAVCAVLFGVPLVQISYHVKTSGLLHDLDMDQHCISMERALDPASGRRNISEPLQRLWIDHAAARTRLERTGAALRVSVGEAETHLLAIFEGEASNDQ